LKKGIPPDKPHGHPNSQEQ